ncbi:MAG: nuclease-related domain-containing protein [Actinomycetes bacterium]
MSGEAGWTLPGPPDRAAGASAEARHAALARAGRAETEHAALDDLLGPIRTPEPPRARHWGQGAAGERLTAQVLAPLAHAGWAVLHDRRLAGGANLDHLVIGPGGVWVVDSKAYRRNRIKVLGDGRLWYGKWCMDDVLDVVRWAAERVSDVLAVAASPVLCIHGARLPRDPLGWDGVVLASPATLLPALIRSPAGGGGEADVDALARRAAAAFPPAGGDVPGTAP